MLAAGDARSAGRHGGGHVEQIFTPAAVATDPAPDEPPTEAGWT